MKGWCLAVVSLLMLFCLENCNTGRSESSEAITKLSESNVSATEVATLLATKKPFEYFINTSGKVDALTEVQTRFNVEGILASIKIRNGDLVRKGDLIATIYNEKYKLDAMKAEVMLKEKQIAFEDQLVGFRGQDESKLKVIRENVKYSSGLASAEVSYQQAKLDYDNTFIRAPISGIVSDLNLKTGSPVRSGEALCSVYDSATLAVSCEVLESDANTISIGQYGVVKPLFESDKSYQVVIESINPRVNAKTGLVRVLLGLKVKEKLLPGMNVNVTIKVPYNNNIIVPKQAIVLRSGKEVVFTLEDGLAKWHYVKTGRQNGKEIEIIDGLPEGSKVIITNNLQLAHDSPVRERE